MSRAGAILNVAIMVAAGIVAVLSIYARSIGDSTADGLFRLWVTLTLLYLILAKSNRGDDR